MPAHLLKPASIRPRAVGAACSSTARAPEEVEELERIYFFIEKWRFEATKAKLVLAKLPPQRRRYVIEHYEGTNALDDYVEECDRTLGWGGATPSTSSTNTKRNADYDYAYDYDYDYSASSNGTHDSAEPSKKYKPTPPTMPPPMTPPPFRPYKAAAPPPKTNGLLRPTGGGLRPAGGLRPTGGGLRPTGFLGGVSK